MSIRKEPRSLCEYQVKSTLSTTTVKLFDFNGEAEDVVQWLIEVSHMSPLEAKEYIEGQGFKVSRVEISAEDNESVKNAKKSV